jgi:cysteine desulfurase
VFGAAQVREGTIVLSAVEHPAVGAAASKLAGGGRAVVTIAVGGDAVIDPDVAALAADGAAVVAIVMVQNELGVVQPVAAIASAIRKRVPGCHIHVDAAQAFGKVAIDASTLGADTIAIAGHKLHGPKGTGALWLRGGVHLEPLWVGGGQQRGLRGGTQDAPGTAGLGLAAERAIAAMPKSRTRWLELAAIVTSKLAARGVAYRQLVPDQRRSPHILALGFHGVPASALRTVMASRGVYLSTGSSCAERDTKPSPALAAIALPADVGMCRLSFGHDTTTDEVLRATEILIDVVGELSRSGTPS